MKRRQLRREIFWSWLNSKWETLKHLDKTSPGFFVGSLCFPSRLPASNPSWSQAVGTCVLVWVRVNLGEASVVRQIDEKVSTVWKARHSCRALPFVNSVSQTQALLKSPVLALSAPQYNFWTFVVCSYGVSLTVFSHLDANLCWSEPKKTTYTQANSWRAACGFTSGISFHSVIVSQVLLPSPPLPSPLLPSPLFHSAASPITTNGILTM